MQNPRNTFAQGDITRHVARSAQLVEDPTAVGRDEDDYCEAGTQGCSVHHISADSPCRTW